MGNLTLPDERALKIFHLLINQYIRKGQPISSKALADEVDVSLGAASVRNIMAELEKAGYLYSPHTSSGRIPTQKGYRLFVDYLLTTQPVAYKTLKTLTTELGVDSAQNKINLLQTTASLVSDITQLVCVVSMPKQNQLSLEHIEFLPLACNRVLVVLVFKGNEVQNRIISTDKNYTARELQEISNFINQNYQGMDLMSMRKRLLKALKRHQSEMNILMRSALNLASKAVTNHENGEDYLVSGQKHLLHSPDMADIDRLRALFDTFTEKQAMLHLLNNCLKSNGVQIFIGREAGLRGLDDCSVVTAPYIGQKEVLGTLGVIGPTRIDYSHVVSVVDVTVKLLSSALRHHSSIN
jgi:heat-inducible transcriptional repressor